MSRHFEATFAVGVLLGVFAALAVYAARESASVGAGLALAAGGGLGYALRSARARDAEAAEPVGWARGKRA